MQRRMTLWAWLGIAVAVVWTLLPIYWFLKMSLLTPDEIAHGPDASRLGGK